MLEQKVHILQGDEELVVAEALGGFLQDVRRIGLGPVQDDLYAAGIEKLLHVGQAPDVASPAGLDINAAVDIADGREILLALLLEFRNVQADDLVDAAVVIELGQTDGVISLIQLVRRLDGFSIF